jgi:hypothetical protein
MKQIQTALKFLIAIALAAVSMGCASSTLLDRENVAAGAGFKLITPTKPDQQALLRKLPADKVTRINHGGKTYYVLPDLANNQAYVGGPKQYQTYQKLRRTQEKNSDPHWFEAAPDANQMDQINAMNWDEWNGWTGVGAFGWY